MPGLGAPVEALPGTQAPPLAVPGDWTRRPVPEADALTMGRPLDDVRPVAMEPTGVTALTGVLKESGDCPLLRSRLP